MPVRYVITVSDDAATLIEASLDTGEETLAIGVVPVDADEETRDSFVDIDAISNGQPVKDK